MLLLTLLHSAATELERRYREAQAVYEEDMLHRHPGDATSLASAELSFSQPQQLLQEEVGSRPAFQQRVVAMLATVELHQC